MAISQKSLVRQVRSAPGVSHPHKTLNLQATLLRLNRRDEGDVSRFGPKPWMAGLLLPKTCVLASWLDHVENNPPTSSSSCAVGKLGLDSAPALAKPSGNHEIALCAQLRFDILICARSSTHTHTKKKKNALGLLDLLATWVYTQNLAAALWLMLNYALKSPPCFRKSMSDKQ